MFHPVVDAWFRRRFTDPTPVQAMGWPAIAEGRDVLLAAPTGSGKTLAAFLYCLDALVRESMEGTLEDRTEIVYVSPLKALSNDIRRNLEEPLGELAAMASDLGMRPPAIRTAVRTGDTSATERRQGAKRPPHVLVTTPESFYILLTSESGRRSLAATRTVIVDEIHAVAGDKRVPSPPSWTWASGATSTSPWKCCATSWGRCAPTSSGARSTIAWPSWPARTAPPSSS